MESIIEYALIVVGGLLGSAHCVGMCGGFVLALGTTRQRWPIQLVRQTIYGCGRVFTYTVGGALVGLLGAKLSSFSATVVPLQAIFCLIAGMLLVVEGCWYAGWLPLRNKAGNSSACPIPGMYGALLQSTRKSSLFLGGMINGFLPCGLVYAFLALAGSRGNPWQGALTMLAFGVGTMPLLTLLGMGAGIIGPLWQKQILRVAALCMIVTGCWTLFRGWSYVRDSQECTELHRMCPTTHSLQSQSIHP